MSSLFPTTEGLEKQLSHDHARKQDDTKQGYINAKLIGIYAD